MCLNVAAGGMGTPRALARILLDIAIAYKNKDGSGQISHKTAVAMLDNAVDKGALEFMGALVGYGVFVAFAGENRFMLHQAANDGFRGMYLVGFDGPVASNGPMGFVILCNGDNNGTQLLAHVAKTLLKSDTFGITSGIDWSKVDEKQFSHENLRQEEIVNRGFKELVLDAFELALINLSCG